MEMNKAICKNPWCKATFFYTEVDMIFIKNNNIDNKDKLPPTECKKCRSFNNELSSGVTWEDREYEGDPWAGTQQIKYKISKYK